MSKNDEKIKKLMKVVETKRKALGEKPKTAWNTNGIFKYDGQNHINLNTVHDSNVLVQALAHILTSNASNIEAANLLGVETVEAQHDGYSLGEWTKDFKLRVSQIEWDAEKNKLNALEIQLKNLISEDAKTDMALDEITAALK